MRALTIYIIYTYLYIYMYVTLLLEISIFNPLTTSNDVIYNSHATTNTSIFFEVGNPPTETSLHSSSIW